MNIGYPSDYRLITLKSIRATDTSISRAIQTTSRYDFRANDIRPNTTRAFVFTWDWFSKYSNGSPVNVDWLSRQVNVRNSEISYLKMHYNYGKNNTCNLLTVQLVRSFIVYNCVTLYTPVMS